MEFGQLARPVFHVESRSGGRDACFTQGVELLYPLLLLFV
jgi:hypothetical protein